MHGTTAPLLLVLLSFPLDIDIHYFEYAGVDETHPLSFSPPHSPLSIVPLILLSGLGVSGISSSPYFLLPRFILGSVAIPLSLLSDGDKGSGHKHVFLHS